MNKSKLHMTSSLAEYFQSVGVEELFTLEESVIAPKDGVIEQLPSSTEVEDTNKGNVNNISSSVISNVEESQEQSNDCIIITEPEVSIEATEVVSSSIDSRIGPFADNRPICDCGLIKDLTSRTEARFLLSLLPDMAEMNPRQKTMFKHKIVQLISEVDRFDLIEEN